VLGSDRPGGSGYQEHRVYTEEGFSVRTLRALPGGGTLRSGIGGSAAVEASIPKLLGGSNVEPVGWGVVRGAVESLVEEAVAFVRPVGDPLAGRLVRVDSVRDFTGVASWEQLAPVLSSGLYYRRSRARMFRDASRGGAVTAALGNTRFQAQLYDKFAESGLDEARGRLRFELRMGKGWVEKSLASLDVEGRVADVRREVFDDAGFGNEVRGMGEVYDAICRQTDLGPVGAARFYAWLLATADGIHYPASKATLAKYRRLRRQMRLTIMPTRHREAVPMRLDYDAGELRVAS
jgi:hypothetical protein